MTEITTISDRASNGRHKPSRANFPAATKSSTVLFEMNLANKRLTFSMKHIGGDDLVGEIVGMGFYLAVPKDETVKIVLRLSDSWDWTFVGTDDDFTVFSAGHKDRYWVQDSGNAKERTIYIKSSGKTPENGNGTGKHDEKFNMAVMLKQDNGSPDVGIEIDPIVKNPPPGGGRLVTTGNAVPLGLILGA